NPLSTGSVELTKVGEEGDTLEGAEFTLVDEAGEELQTGLTTNEEGILVVEDLKPGNYAFIETEAPFGYQLDSTPLEFEIEFDQQEMLELEVENRYIPSSFELTKEGEDGELLEGVVFELQDAEENTIQEGLETNAEGKLLIDDLTPGSYQLVETATIDGYELDTTPITFEIGLGQTEVTEVTFENPLSPGSVELTKVGENGDTLEGAVFTLVDEEGEELEAGLTTNEEGILVVEDLKPGNYAFIETEAPFGYQLNTTPIEFEIVFDQQEVLEIEAENSLTTGSVELTKTGEDGNNLEGVIFELQDAEGETLQEDLVTDENGVLLIENLKPGNYQLVEIETIAGYELYSLPIPFEIEIGQTEVTEINFENSLSTGAVELTKVDEVGESLEGAVFELMDEAGNLLQTGLTTNESGKLLIEDLKPGNYQLVETAAPFGYTLDDEPIQFEIVFNQQEPITVTAENERAPSSVVLTKVDDETGQTLAGAVFQIIRDGEVFKGNLVTDENGQLFVEGLKPGSYQFIETEAPDGYTLDPKPIEFTIDLGQSETLALTTDNSIIKGDFVLTKLDFDNTELALDGVTFDLQDADGNTIREGLQTAENGKLIIEDLRPGQYLLVETDPLTGYQAHPPVSFTIGKGQLEAKQITITNKLTRSGVELTKLDRDNEDKVLSGAEFMLQDEEGNIVAQGLTTDQNGKLIVDGLKPGVYSFTETKAPQGYVLEESSIEFTVELGQSERTEVKAYNQKEHVSNDREEVNQEESNLPSTATNMFNYALFGGVLMIAGIFVLIFYRRRKQ
uniref:SpaA isopeptide-forming pilin-related protein n=1 Tax=Gracilibacillus suaedae TaxID=2820273 RepID=UPI001ABE52AD